MAALSSPPTHNPRQAWGAEEEPPAASVAASAKPEASGGHEAVMLAPMLRELAPVAGERYIDGTYGGGGYTRALLEEAACEVVALDRDPDVIPPARADEARYAPRLAFLSGRFGAMDQLCAAFAPVDGIVLDVGVSSMQLDTPERGFSFRYDAPLDMRMGQEGPGAAELVNTATQGELAEMLYHYGGERASHRIARAIVRARERGAIHTTHQLRDIVHRVLPPRRMHNIDPATRTFQALRIAVNQELQELDDALAVAPRLLKPGGRLVVVTFHSAEDRRVKQALERMAERQTARSRHDPAALLEVPSSLPLMRLPGKKALRPDAVEVAANPRARSARMRVAVRTQAGWDDDGGTEA